MNDLERLNQSIAYIEAHLEDEISYEEVAKVACCSLYHYQRMFSYIANISLGEYIRRRRLSLAALRLQKGEERVLDVALLYGYQSPTAFTRAFMNMHGIQPIKAREPGAKLKLFPPISFQISIKGEEAMNYRIENKEGFRLVGVKESISTVDGQNFIRVPQMWKDTCEQGLYQIILELSNGNPSGVLGACANFRENEFDYYIASSSEKPIPNGMVELEVKATTWVIFECKGTSGIQDAFKRLYSEWFPNSGYEHTGGAEIEWYSDGDASAEDYYCEVWIPIKKK